MTNEIVVHEGQLVELVHIPREGKKPLEFARRGPGTRLIILDADDRILLTREVRRETGGLDLRLPGGKVFDSLVEWKSYLASGQDMLAAAASAAAREAEEEVAVHPLELTHLTTSGCGATMEWDLYYFLCRRWEPLDSQSLEDGEKISLEWTPLSDVLLNALTGKMAEGRSVSELAKFAFSEGRLSIGGV